MTLRETGKLFLRLMRIGYVSGTFLADVPLLLLAFADAYRYRALDLALLPPVSSALRGELPVAAYGLAVNAFLLLTVAIPASLAYLRVRLHRPLRIPLILRTRGASVVAAHVLVALLIAGAVVVGAAAEGLSGPGSNGRLADSLFSSWLLATVDSTVVRLGTIVTLAVHALVHIFLLFEFEGKQLAGGLGAQFARSAFLADIQTSLRARHGRSYVNANAASLAPEMTLTASLSDRYVRAYQERVPGSPAARKYLETLLTESRAELHELFPDVIYSERGLYFFPGTTRAAEFALSSLSAQVVVLSPYEHPSVVRAATIFCKQANVTLVQIACEPAFVLNPWDAQFAELKNRFSQLKAQLTPPTEASAQTARRQNSRKSDARTAVSSQQRTVLVLSEVCWRTGCQLPIAEIRGSLVTAAGSNIHLLVDAAHAPGNDAACDAAKSANAYVFGTHKWLLSPEPCGVLVLPEALREDQIPYDCCGEHLPLATMPVRALAGLRATCEVLRECGTTNLAQRGRSVRMLFEELLSDRFTSAHQLNGLPPSNLVCILPAKGWEWTTDAASTEKTLLRARIYTTIVPFLETPLKNFGLRIAFSHFLDESDIRHIVRTLFSLIRPNKALRPPH